MRKTILLSALGLTLALSGTAFAGSDDAGRGRNEAHTEKSRAHDDTGKHAKVRSERRSSSAAHRDGDNDGDRHDGGRKHSDKDKHHGERRS